MGSNKNAFYSNSFLIFITRFFPSLANLAVMIYYSKQLPALTYGSYTNFWVQLYIVYSLICFGLHSFIVTYPGKAILKLAGTIKPAQYTLYAIWAAALAAAFAILQFKTTGIPFYIPFLFAISFSLTFIAESLLMSFKAFKVLVAVNVSYALLFWMAHYCALSTAFSASFIFSILLVINIIKLITYIAYFNFIITRKDPAETNIALPPHQEIKSLWLHLGIFDVVQNLSLWVDKFIISLLFTSAVSAVYYNGSQNIPFIPLLIGAAGNAILIQLATGDKGNQAADAIALMNQTGKMLSCIVFPVFFFLLSYSHELFIKVFTLKYEAAVPVFVASLFILPVRAYSFTTILQKLHKGAIINKGAIGEIIVALMLMYPLYLWLGFAGIALSFVVSTYLQAAFYVQATAKALQVKPLQLLPVSNWAAKLVLFGVLFYSIHWCTSQLADVRMSIIGGGVFMTATIALSLWVEVKKKISGYSA